VICAWRCVYLYLAQVSAIAQSALQRGSRTFPLQRCFQALQCFSSSSRVEQLAGVAFEFGGPPWRGVFREDPLAGSLTDEFTLWRA
jgi:hypothetical protein